MKVFNFQDPTHKTDFGTSRGTTVFHLLKKPVGNQYLKNFRILVHPEILVSLEISAQFEKHSPYVQLNIFLDSIDKKGFSICCPVTICNFPEKLAQNKYMRRILEY